jgi:predicted nucleic acid-binding protein
MVLVDSNIWIRANQPKGDLLAKVALESLLEEDEAAFCGPVKLEVLGAMRPPSRPRFDTFFSLVPHLPMDAATWDHSVIIGRALYDQARVTLPWNDVLIAAIAQRNRCRVYTMDDHFKIISRVTGIRLYEPGVGGTFNPDHPTP